MNSWPFFAEDECAAVQNVLASGKVNYWTGSQCRLFEEEFAAYTHRKHGIAVANGTLALELALEAFGIGKGDEVITSCWTFIASASCAVARGATPILADVDPLSLTTTRAALKRVYTPRTKAIICVHLLGWPCDMAGILAFAREHQLFVIEDCAQAHGAMYHGQPVGSFGHAAAFSFCQDKIMTTGGEGGMLVLDDETAWKRAWAYKDHGKNWDSLQKAHAGAFRFVHDDFGSNWRMTEMQAAIGRIQLAKLPDWHQKRTENAKILQDALSSQDALCVPEPPKDIQHAWYKFCVTLTPEAVGKGIKRDALVADITQAGIPCLTGVCPEIYLEKAFTRRGLGPTQPLTTAQDLGARTFLLLVHPTLSAAEMRHTAETVIHVLNHHLRQFC